MSERASGRMVRMALEGSVSRSDGVLHLIRTTILLS